MFNITETKVRDMETDSRFEKEAKPLINLSTLLLSSVGSGYIPPLSQSQTSSSS